MGVVWQPDPDNAYLSSGCDNLALHRGAVGAAESQALDHLGFIVPTVSAPQLLNFSARTESDYGLTITTSQIFHILPVIGIDMWLWGVPADPIHDSARFRTPPVRPGACPPGPPRPPARRPRRSRRARSPDR